jgi:hypothetical protein
MSVAATGPALASLLRDLLLRVDEWLRHGYGPRPTVLRLDLQLVPHVGLLDREHRESDVLLEARREHAEVTLPIRSPLPSKIGYTSSISLSTYVPTLSPSISTPTSLRLAPSVLIRASASLPTKSASLAEGPPSRSSPCRPRTGLCRTRCRTRTRGSLPRYGACGTARSPEGRAPCRLPVPCSRA